QGAGAAAANSRDRLQLTDGALSSIGDVLSQVRSLAVQGSSDTYGPDNRAALGAQVRGLFQSALDSANVRASDGEYLLAGASSMRAVLEQDMQQSISRFVEVDTVTAASELAKASQSLEVSRAVSSHIIAMLNPST